jgi:hypothetical protein
MPAHALLAAAVALAALAPAAAVTPLSGWNDGILSE